MNAEKYDPTALETGLIGGPEKRELVIEDYNPDWPERFARHKDRIEPALSGLKPTVEHIGSTSVAGLPAKPIIDILLIVPDSADEETYLPQLLTLGYQLRVREPDFNEHRMLRTPERDVHIHVFSAGNGEIDRYRLFRQHLQNNPDRLTAYAALKRELAKKSWQDMNEYADAKSGFIEEAIACERKADVQKAGTR
ncbi:GrpB family protein [Roseibium sp. RKSG952]|nr:GrpB family protein [Roseibium sp. RKSG952]